MLIKEQLGRDRFDRIRRKWSRRCEAAAKINPAFDDERATKLCVLLENTEEAFRRKGFINETTQVGNIAAGIKTAYFDIITAAYPGLIAEDLFSVQPLQSKVGQVFFMQYKYGTSKGNVQRGETIFGHNYIADASKSNYTSETIDNEAMVAPEASSTELVGNLAYSPIFPGTVSITQESANGVILTDNGNGALSGTVGITGTINYETGAYDITFTTPLSGTDAFNATYQYDMGIVPQSIPEIEVQLSDLVVTARPRKLKGTYSLDAAYDLKMAQGIEISDALLEAAATQLKFETDRDLIRQCWQQAAFGSVWLNNYNPNENSGRVSKKEFYETFIGTVIESSSKILQKTKRVQANWIVCGKNAYDILTYLGAPRFVCAQPTNTAGPHYNGMLDGRWKVYSDPFLAEDQFLMGYKGDTLVDAGLIYCPYLPFFATDTVMLEDFVGRRGFATQYGKLMVDSNLYVKGQILTSANAQS